MVPLTKIKNTFLFMTSQITDDRPQITQSQDHRSQITDHRSQDHKITRSQITRSQDHRSQDHRSQDHRSQDHRSQITRSPDKSYLSNPHHLAFRSTVNFYKVHTGIKGLYADALVL
jgi:hypothetical protein